MKIGVFGCSFSEGGGLNSPDFLKFAIKNNLLPKGKYNHKDEKREAVMKYHRYSTLVGKELSCEVDNYAKSRGSNEYILKTLYENYKKYDVCIVQFSYYFRQYIWSDKQKKFHNVNGLYKMPDMPQDVIDYFEKTHTEYHNEDYEKSKISMFVKLFDNLLKDKKVIWLFQDHIPENLETNNLVSFDSIEGNGNIAKYIEENKLDLTSATNGEFNDGHYSVEGHQKIADKIIERLK